MMCLMLILKPLPASVAQFIGVCRNYYMSSVGVSSIDEVPNQPRNTLKLMWEILACVHRLSGNRWKASVYLLQLSESGDPNGVSEFTI